MASKYNLEKILSSLPAIIEIAKKYNYSISIKTLRKILNLKSNRETIYLINHLCMITNNISGSPENFLNVFYEGGKVFFVKDSLLELDQFFFPLTERDLKNLYSILKKNPILLRKIYLSENEKTNEKSQEEIKKIFKQAIQDKKIVIFLYKKMNSYLAEIKKIIPIKLEELYSVFYIMGYDLNEKKSSKYKIYRSDRIIKIESLIENNRRIKFKDIPNKSIAEIIHSQTIPEKEIVFAYDPLIEINLKKELNFRKLNQTIKVENKEWKIGKIKTKFPEFFIEKVIYFIKFIYILKPKEMNLKIKEYLENLKNKLIKNSNKNDL